MSSEGLVRLPGLRSVAEFAAASAELGLSLPIDTAESPDTSALAAPIPLYGRQAPNRFCIQPMEGWDGTPDGRPTDLTSRRWERFGRSGAGLIWGCEAVAVRHDGRANPCQLVLRPETAPDLERLLERLLRAYRDATGGDGRPVVGLQLTHSGRYCRPTAWDRPEPRIAANHPLLDARMGLTADYAPVTDGWIRSLIEDYARAAALAQRIGFDFVDLKHCHGYFGHELLGALYRPGAYGGCWENRTRYLRELVDAVRSSAPRLGLAVRFSAFDTVPYMPDPYRSAPGRPGPGIPVPHCHCMPYVYGFGVDRDAPTDIDLTEPARFMSLLSELGIEAANITGGSPYTNPHVQRPALYPPSDGYAPPEDPLVGVARHMHVTRHLRGLAAGPLVVGTAYTYLQDFVPHVAAAAVAQGWTDFVGLGRMVLSYPGLPLDALQGRLERKRVCRTFSDCTTAPRNGLPSGCYPLDERYKRSPEARRLAERKSSARSSR
ncbi:MAG: NADH:flavin oxidoreductase [Armatimonadetes bacterium]|nr:NADH:flavin oxidoreductase [Armatimonadota bacterium]